MKSLTNLARILALLILLGFASRAGAGNPIPVGNLMQQNINGGGFTITNANWPINPGPGVTIVTNADLSITVSFNATNQNALLVTMTNLVNMANSNALVTATNLSAAERSALIATNLLLLTAISNTNNANLTITFTTITNLAGVAQTNAMIVATNLFNQAIASINNSNTFLLTTTTNLAGLAQTNAMIVATNLAAAERAAMIQTNLATLAADNLSNQNLSISLLTTSTNLAGVAQTNAMIVATNLAAAERAAMVATNLNTLAVITAISPSNTLNTATNLAGAAQTNAMIVATNLAAAERAAMVATNLNTLAVITAISPSNTLNTATNLAGAAQTNAMIVATNLATAERAAMIQTNLATLAADNASNLNLSISLLTTATNLAGAAQTNAMVISTNLATAERAAMIQTNLATLAADNASNLNLSVSLLTTATNLAGAAQTNAMTISTNLAAAERAALIATNTATLAALAASNNTAAILTIATNLAGVAQTNAMIVATNLATAERAAMIATNANTIASITNGAKLSTVTMLDQVQFGSFTNHFINTNFIKVGSCGVPYARGIYMQIVNGVWTNVVTATHNQPGNYSIVNSSGIYNLLSNGFTIYLTNSINGQWLTGPFGAVPGPFVAYEEEYRDPVLGGFILATDLVAQVNILISTNIFAITNGGTPVFGVIGGTTSSNFFSACGSNYIASMLSSISNNAAASNFVVTLIQELAQFPTNGITSTTASNIVATYGALILANTNFSNIGTGATNVVNAIVASDANQFGSTNIILVTFPSGGTTGYLTNGLLMYAGPTFTNLVQIPVNYSDPKYLLYDVSHIHYGGKYYLAYLAQNSPGYLGIATSPDDYSWTFYGYMSFTNELGTNFGQSCATGPKWLVDSTNGLDLLVCGATNQAANFNDYVMHVNPANPTNFWTFQKLNLLLDTNQSADNIGAGWWCFPERGAYPYYLLTAQGHQYNATNPFGTWNFQENINTNVGAAASSPVIVRDGTNYDLSWTIANLAQYSTSPDMTNWIPFINAPNGGYVPSGCSGIADGTAIQEYRAFTQPNPMLSGTNLVGGFVGRFYGDGSGLTNLHFVGSGQGLTNLQVIGFSNVLAATAGSTNIPGTDQNGHNVSIPWANLPSGGGGGSTPNAMTTNSAANQIISGTVSFTNVIQLINMGNTVSGNGIGLTNLQQFQTASSQLITIGDTLNANGSSNLTLNTFSANGTNAIRQLMATNAVFTNATFYSGFGTTTPNITLVGNGSEAISFSGFTASRETNWYVGPQYVYPQAIFTAIQVQGLSGWDFGFEAVNPTNGLGNPLWPLGLFIADPTNNYPGIATPQVYCNNLFSTNVYVNGPITTTVGISAPGMSSSSGGSSFGGGVGATNGNITIPPNGEITGNGNGLTNLVGAISQIAGPMITTNPATGQLVPTYNGAGLTNLNGATAFTGQSCSNSQACVTGTNFCSLAVPAGQTNMYEVGGYINVTAVSVDVVQMKIYFTDENNAAQVFNLMSTGIGTTGFNPISNQQIVAKGGTTIVLSNALTTGAGSITYDTGGNIKLVKAYP